jgi:hypothetical protein
MAKKTSKSKRASHSRRGAKSKKKTVARTGKKRAVVDPIPGDPFELPRSRRPRADG